MDETPSNAYSSENGNSNGSETRNFSGGSETHNFSGESAGNNSSTDSSSTSSGPTGTPGRTEEFKVSGEDLMARIRQLIEEGNARRIIVRNAEGKDLFEVPLTAGLIGAVLLPVATAIGAALALAAQYTIVVVKRA